MRVNYYWNCGYMDGSQNRIPDYNLFEKNNSQWNEGQRNLYFKGYRCGVREQDKATKKKIGRAHV